MRPCKPASGDEDADEVADLKDYTDELTRCKHLFVCGSCGEERNANETRAGEFEPDDAIWRALQRPPLDIPGQALKCCDKCFVLLNKGRKPPHAILFRKPVAFDLLQQLTPLELRLISPRVVIMTTVTSSSGQRGVRGQTMSVDSVTRLLPRLMDDAAVVSVRITQGASGVVRKEPVRPALLRRALLLCIKHKVAAFEDVTISEANFTALDRHNEDCAAECDDDDVPPMVDDDVDTEEIDDIFLMEQVNSDDVEETARRFVQGRVPDLHELQPKFTTPADDMSPRCFELTFFYLFRNLLFFRRGGTPLG